VRDPGQRPMDVRAFEDGPGFGHGGFTTFPASRDGS
jgi:hypothetical protein